MTQEQRTHILRGLPKNSPVKYIGGDIKDRKGEKVVIKNNSTGFKKRNVSRARQGDCMAVYIAGGRYWYFAYRDLTCKAIEVIERLEQSANIKQ